jgi:DNA-binding IclR family transcriptional regulator
MEQIGLLDRNADGTYGLGLRLMELGSLVEARLDLPRIADPVLRQLRQDLDQTSFLTVRHGFVATCIDRVAGTNVDVLSLRLGGALPLYCGAGPRVLLAQLSPSELDTYLTQAPFAPLTPHTLTSAKQLRADILRTRADGHTLSMEDVTPGVAAIGAAVTDAAGQVVAAISVAGLKHMYEGTLERRTATRVVAAAAEVSAALGAPMSRRPSH